ncbi:MAG: discoidin domain-containing protein [Gemmatimonadaceae bacterium]
MRSPVALAILLLGAVLPLGAQTRAEMLDDFESVDGWIAAPSEGVTLKISSAPGQHGRAMRLDFDFHGGGGYAIARKMVDLALPANYQFQFSMRGSAPTENLEFKLVDPSGENVWWNNARNVAFSTKWSAVTRGKRDISFAWGPIGGGAMTHVGAVEIAITAGSGGKGTVWIDDFTFTERPPSSPFTGTPLTAATSSAPGHATRFAVDGDSTTDWRSIPTVGAGATPPSITLDLGGVREIGGLSVMWSPGLVPAEYLVQLSNDGETYRDARSARRGAGTRNFIALPETETRYIRLATAGSDGGDVGVREIVVEPVAFSESRNAFYRAVAKASVRGTYPKYLADSVQSYWTVVGVDKDVHEGLLNEEGMLETDAGAFSIEPFLRLGDTLVTWGDVKTAQRLEGDALPVPTAEWTRGDITLAITAFADGPAGASSLLARYVVTNNGTGARPMQLVLALRPFQVNPPWQFLNVPGGAASIRTMAREGNALRVNGNRLVASLTAPTRTVAERFDAGGVIGALREKRLPPSTVASDSSGGAEGAFVYDLELAPGASQTIYLEAPFGRTRPRLGDGNARFNRTVADWSVKLGGVEVTLPASASRVAETLRSTLAYILINRDGAGIQPGSRSYTRSWIRDGSLTSAALLRLGHFTEVREFLEWYARYQYPSGKVPCCVDTRGADPVPENDSHGQLIFLAAEYLRYTHDHATVEKLWPKIARAVAYIDSLRHEPQVPSQPIADTSAIHGLMPQSISHEGYSAKAMHSYWDDFFTLRGLKDATDLAGALGHAADATRYASMRDDFRRDLYASIGKTMAMHHIDFIPGSVELGDFDATSTTVAVAPVDELGRLDSAALWRTFEKYYASFVARRAGRGDQADYTPYELRVMGTFVRLGQRDRAQAALDFFLADQRPAAWRQWAEVVWRDPSTPKFIGDMPHTWVGSDFIRSALDMFAYEREADSALVVGAGIAAKWVTEAPGVAVRRLRTTHGPLDLTMRADGDSVVATLGGLASMPRGGIVLSSPLARPLQSATIEGQAARLTATGEVIVERLPATIVLRY